MKHLRKIFSVFSTVLLILATVLVVAVFALRLTGAKPRFMGYYIFNVASDSMTPTLKVDDVILVKECEKEDIHKDDIITYHGKEGDFAGKDITHRVVEEPTVDEGGTMRIRTRGTKFGAVEDPEITFEQVIGKYVRTLKVLTFVYGLFRKWYGFAIFLGLIFLLIGKELFNLMKLSQKVDNVEIEQTVEDKKGNQ